MRAIALLSIAFCLPLGVLAQSESACNPESQDCTVKQALDFYRGETIVEAIGEEVVNSNRPTTPPDTFAGHLHNSYQDYLNLLSFAINDVEESDDGKALVIRWNPIRNGNHLIGTTLTIAKPAVADAVRNAIPESERDSTVSLLEKQFGDDDDRTWSASYSYASPSCLPDLDPNTNCYGRKPSTYDDLLVLLLPEVSMDSHQIAEMAKELASLFGEEGDVLDWKLSNATNRAAAIATIRDIVKAEKASGDRALSAFKSRHLGPPSPDDRQPAAVQRNGRISHTWRSRGPERAFDFARVSQWLAQQHQQTAAGVSGYVVRAWRVPATTARHPRRTRTLDRQDRRNRQLHQARFLQSPAPPARLRRTRVPGDRSQVCDCVQGESPGRAPTGHPARRKGCTSRSFAGGDS